MSTRRCRCHYCRPDLYPPKRDGETWCVQCGSVMWDVGIDICPFCEDALAEGHA